MASLPSRPELNTESVFLCYGLNQNSELHKVKFEDESIKGTLSIGLDPENNFRVEISDATTGEVQRVRDLFIREINSELDLQSRPTLKKHQILHEIHTKLDGLEESPETGLFLTFEGGKPKLTIQGQVTQEVDDSKESNEELLVDVPGHLERKGLTMRTWELSRTESGGSRFSISMKNRTPEFKLVNPHGKEIALGLVQLGRNSRNLSQEGTYNFLTLSKDDQKRICEFIASGSIRICFEVMSRATFDVYFPVVEGEAEDEIFQILDKYVPVSVEEKPYSHRHR